MVLLLRERIVDLSDAHSLKIILLHRQLEALLVRLFLEKVDELDLQGQAMVTKLCQTGGGVGKQASSKLDAGGAGNPAQHTLTCSSSMSLGNAPLHAWGPAVAHR